MKLLRHFTLSMKGSVCARVCVSGEIYSQLRTTYIDVRISGGNDVLQIIKENYSNAVFDISFHSNRSTFQLQHNALNWMEKHELFSLIIKNPLYDITAEKTFNYEPGCGNKIFHCAQTRELNYEQKIAMFNIVNKNNSVTPYLLFGPPGILHF